MKAEPGPFLVPTGPHFHLLEGAAPALGPLSLAMEAHEATFVARLQGASCRVTKDLLTTFAHALRFPDYYGHNWDALDECLTDLDWLEARHIVLVIEGADQVLGEEPADREILLEILVTTAEAWAEAGLPERPMSFHVLLQGEPKALKVWKDELGELEIPFEVRTL